MLIPRICHSAGGAQRANSFKKPGFIYRPQHAPNLTGPWDILGTQTAPASGLMEFHDTNAPPDGAFYRTVTP